MATHPLMSMPSPMMWKIVPLPKESATSRNSMHESKNASPVTSAIDHREIRDGDAGVHVFRDKQNSGEWPLRDRERRCGAIAQPAGG